VLGLIIVRLIVKALLRGTNGYVGVKGYIQVGIFPFACSGNVPQGSPQVVGVDANGNPVSGNSVDYCKQ